MIPEVDKIVNIIIVGDNVSVDREPVDVSTKGNEQVVWKADFDFDIVFPEGSPFPSGHVFPSAANHAKSGPPRPDSGGGRKYKYIVVPRGRPTVRPLDPTVRPTP